MKNKKEEDIDVPATAHEVPKGYAVHLWDSALFDMTVHIYGPIMASPRPRVTMRGTFMPSNYRTHCNKLGASLAFARGLQEKQRNEPWRSNSRMHLDLAFWCPKMPGDLDNLAKTIMDSGQLHKKEPPGAELWLNDKQIVSLSVVWIPTTEPDMAMQTVVRVRLMKDYA